MDYLNLTISEISNKLASGEVTSQQLVEQTFQRIENVEPKIEAFVNLLKDRALTKAEESDFRIKDGKRLSKIDGIPISVKDLVCMKGIETTASSNILKNFTPEYDSTVVRKLEDAGAVIIGKTNLDAFAHGSSTENSDFQTTKNPWDLTRVPGGSSGGSAAAVAANESYMAIGTDTGGSIRHPASCCSVVGLKPSYGRVSRFGVIAMASSLDVVGPIAKSSEDAAIILEIIAGQDELDSTTTNAPVPKYSELLDRDLSNFTLGIPKEYFASGMDEDVEKVIKEAIEKFRSLGAKIVDISLPHTDYGLATYYIIQPAEVSSNLSRYDGIRYGRSVLREDKNLKLDEVYFNSRGEGFGDEAKRRIMLGTHVLSAGYFDAYYKRALKIRTLVKRDFDQAFEKVDAILTPVAPTPAFKVGEKSDDPVQMYLSDIYTVPINPAGVPAISTPAGFVKREGKDLPVGLQIIGPILKEEVILNIAHQFEKNTDFIKKKADI